VGIIGAIIGRVIDHEIEKHIKLVLETRPDYNQKVFLYNSPGDASVPCKEDRILIVKIDGTTGSFAALGMLVESQDAKPGEKIFYARNADGEIVSKISMLDSGDIKTEADGDISSTNKKNQEYKADENLTLEAKKKSTLKGADVELNGKVVATGGSFKCAGSVAPSGNGALCGCKFCYVTGAPVAGEEAQGT